jgi:hypothetical protein
MRTVARDRQRSVGRHPKPSRPRASVMPQRPQRGRVRHAL